MQRKTLAIFTVLAYLLIIVGVVMAFLYIFPNREAVQIWIKGQGTWGPILLFAIAAVSVIIAPLNYSMVGLVGGFLYPTPLAFLILWLGRSFGHLVNFWIARRFGRHVLSFFIKETSLESYDKLLQSEKVAELYFALCFLPFMPGEYLAYMLGASNFRKRVFIFVTFIGNMGSAFSLAYLGSGKGFTDAVFLVLFILIFISGLLWIHKEKKKLHLQ